jgi:serine/threonine protein kinase
MPLAPGTHLGPYEITGPLGAGGMGEVYRARDTRLDRTVAIKILSKEMSNDPAHKQRFEREAKTISSLNHPHICTLHDIGCHNGTDYLVMEYVEGESLAHRLEKGPLLLDQVLKIGRELADALDKAHRNGIIHRDIKPGNIMLTKSGAKLLDFGLARSTTASDTLATFTATAPKSPLTQEGTIVGTFQYMSPEQVEGKELDSRSDIFSLGAVLYEMLTGQRAFPGKSSLSVASAILEKDPAPISSLKPLTPPSLEHVIRRCLAKDPDDRWQNTKDLSSELKWISESGVQANSISPEVTAKGTQTVLPWIISGALALLLVGAFLWWRNSKPQEQTMQFYAPLPFPAQDLAIAPNGHTVAVVGYLEFARKNALWTYDVGTPEAKNLPDTEGATYPFWSPDGRFLAFFADGKLKKLEVSGGPVQTLCDAPSGRGGTWNKAGVIVFTPNATPGTGLYRVSASGGRPSPISSPDASRGETAHRWPMFLPDGAHFLYLAANFTGRKEVNAIFVGSLLDSKEKHFVMKANTNVAYAAPGYLVYYHDKTLLAQPFDLKRFALSGETATIQTQIEYQPQVARAVFAVSDNGLLVSQTGNGVTLSQPVWFDRHGLEAGAVGKPEVYGNVSIAPSGRSLLVDIVDLGTVSTNIWTYDLQRDSATRVTFSSGFNYLPIWSPDAARLVFGANTDVGRGLFMKNSDGTQEERSIAEDDFDKLPDDWSRDGKYILYTRGTDLWFVMLPELRGRLFLKGLSIFRNGQFSPDGKWVAYASNETGKWEIYVNSFPDARSKWQISAAGGEQPRWRGDGKELFYLSAAGKMMAAPVTTGNKFAAGTPVALFPATPRQRMSSTDMFSYDVSRDGQRFLINTPVKQAETAPMTVILNWPAKLNK